MKSKASVALQRGARRWYHMGYAASTYVRQTLPVVSGITALVPVHQILAAYFRSIALVALLTLLIQSWQPAGLKGNWLQNVWPVHIALLFRPIE